MQIIRDIVSAVLLALAITAMLAIFLAGASRSADLCLTKSEARAKWPNSHLYWHGPDHCWDNRSSRRHRLKREPTIAPEPLSQIVKRALLAQAAKPDAEVKPDPDHGIDGCCWPPLASLLLPVPLPADSNPTPDMLLNGWPWLIDGNEPLQEFQPWDRRVNR